MQIALVDDAPTIAEPNAPKTATCPACGGAVELRCRAGTYFWRHERIPPGRCSASRGQPSSNGDKDLDAIARKCGGTVFSIPLADASVHTIVTSPPYWPQRRYEGAQGLVWPGIEYRTLGGTVRLPGDVNCTHDWVETSGDTCALCGAWRGALGLEPGIEMYVGHLVAVAREAWRVLRPDGTFWLNLGDAYVNSKKWGGRSGAKNYTSAAGGCAGQRRRFEGDLPPKSLAGVPWRVAFALQGDGWTLRRDHVWAKGVSFASQETVQIVHAWAAARGVAERAADELLALLQGQLYVGNAMPESAVDRATTAHEYVFLFAKSSRYYYNLAAAQEARAYPPSRDGRRPNAGRQAQRNAVSGGSDGSGASTLHSGDPERRRIRSVWAIPTVPGQERPRCEQCNTPWDPTPLRIHRAWKTLGADFKLPVSRKAGGDNGHKGAPLFDEGVCLQTESQGLMEYLEAAEDEHGLDALPLTCPRCGVQMDDLAHFAAFPPSLPRRCLEIGCPAQVCAACGAPWEEDKPTCDCDGPFGEAHDGPARPGLALDMFVGTGTTVQAAHELGLLALGLDLSARYLHRIAVARTAAVQQEMRF